MKIKNYQDNRRQLRELFYRIAADITKRNIDSPFLKGFEIVNVQSAGVSYPAFRNRKDGEVISVSGGVDDDSVELSIHKVVELQFDDHPTYYDGTNLFWWAEDWPLKVSVSCSDWVRLVHVQPTDNWPSSRIILRFFLQEVQKLDGDDEITDVYVERILNDAYPEILVARRNLD